MRCLGTAQHLKSRFGQGYELELKTALPPPESAEPDRTETALNDWLAKAKLSAELLEHASVNSFRYRLRPESGRTLGDVFGARLDSAHLMS